MIVDLNVSTVARGKNLSASFHRVSPRTTHVEEKTYKQFTGSPDEVTTKVLHELDISKTYVRSFHCSPDVPPDVCSIMQRAILSYSRAHLPIQRANLPTQKRGLLKVSYSEEKGHAIVNVLHYNSIQDEELNIKPIGFSGPLPKVANKVFKTLVEDYGQSVVLQFEGVPKEIQDLFCSIVSLYNKGLSQN